MLYSKELNDLVKIRKENNTVIAKSRIFDFNKSNSEIMLPSPSFEESILKVIDPYTGFVEGESKFYMLIA
jgi:hypothetical protein